MREWFEGTVVEILPDLFGTALRLTRNRADAEDLVADTVVRAWTHLDELTDRTRLRGWMFRILTNTFLSARRADARHGVHESLDDATDDGFSLFEQIHAPILLWWGTPERVFLDKLLREDLTRALDGLPDPFRVVVILADMHGCTYQEIAETLQLPIGTVRSRLAERGRCCKRRCGLRHRKRVSQGADHRRRRPIMTDAPVINCEEALQRLLEYLDAELQGEQQREMEQHLERCRSCFSRVEFEKRLKSYTGELRHEPVSPDLERHIRTLLDTFKC